MRTSTATPAPPSLRGAATSMYVGLALSALLAALTLIDQVAVDGITDELWQKYPDYTSDEIATEAGATAVGLYAIAVLGIACWTAVAAAARRGWRRTRVTATTVFALAVLTVASASYVPVPGYLLAGMWLPCIAGLAAVVMLWTSPSPHDSQA